MENRKKRQGRWHRLLLVSALLLCAGIWSWGARAKDTYSVYVSGGGNVSGYSSDTAAEYNGKRIAEFERGNINPGRYTIYIAYAAQTDGGWFEVVDQARGTVLAQGAYPAGQEAVSASFEVKNGQSRIAVRSYQGEGYVYISGYNLYSNGPVYTDTFWILGLLALLVFFFLFCVRRQRAGHPRELQLLLLACVFSLPYLSSHLQYGHDIEFHLSRIFGLGVALRSGQFPVRLNAEMSSVMGGYANSVMYPELFLYFSGAMCALGASVLLAIKVLYILINFFTAYCGYYGARQIVGDEAGMVFTILYLCCPYRLNDIFVRAAVGEALAMAFLPLAAAGIYQLVQGDYKKGFWSAVLGITGVFQSHILSMFLLVVFGVLYGAAVLLWQGRRFWSDRRRPLTVLAAAAATLVLNAWFLVPFLQFSAKFDFYAFHLEGSVGITQTYPWQAFMASYTADYTRSDGLTEGQLSTSVGFVLLPIILLMLYRWLRTPGGTQETKQEKGLMALGSVALFMTSMLFPWKQLEKIPIIKSTFDKLQFSWRLMMIVAVLYYLAAATELLLLIKEKKQILAGILLGLAVIAAVDAGSQYFFVGRAVMLDKTSERSSSGDGLYLLYQCDADDTEKAAREGVQPLTGAARVTGAERQVTGTTFAFVSDDTAADAVFRVPQYYYGLHRATLADGQALAVDTDPKTGLMLVTVPAGIRSGTVRVQYHEPLSFRLATAVSLLAALVLLLLRRREYRLARTLKGA